VTCREFADFIADYLSGELPAGTRMSFDDHLKVCPNCVSYLSNYRDTIALGRRAFADDETVLPDSVPPGLIDAILASRRARH
jgi:anti-sigma factor RsiW